MNTYQVKVLITVAHTLDVQVKGEEDEAIKQAAFDAVDFLLDRVPGRLDEYTTEVANIRKVVDFPKR